MGNPASLFCSENIALFHLLHAGRGKDGMLFRDSVPALPSVGPVETLTTQRKDYILSFERERSLAGALAFISHIEDDPDHIPAVCVQENHDPREGPSLRILLAVNKSKCKDGDQMLEKINKSFSQVFAELSRVVDNTYEVQPDIEHRILRLIIAMCSEKILRRLRLTSNARREARQHPRLRFQNIIHAFRLHNGAITAFSNPTNVSEKERALFVERLKGIVTLVDAYTNHPRPQQLEDLVEEFCRLRKLDCEALLNTISDDIIEKSNRKSTLNMIHKVARYAEVARFLFRTSKRFPIARRMQAVGVRLPNDAFSRPFLDPQYRIGISSMLSRVRAPKTARPGKQKYQKDALCLLLGTSPHKADEDLTTQARRTHTTGKIHAEVQLVLYWEILEKSRQCDDTLLLPRIVSSSKKACFLCDLLIKMHGKMRTPWSHGKLYPGWLVPECPGLDLQKRFNDFLEDRIRMSIALLFERRERTSYPGPSESTLITLPSLGSEPAGVLAPKDPKGDDQVELISKVQNLCAEGVSQNDILAAKADNGGLKSSSGPLQSVVDLGTVHEAACGETNDSVEWNPVCRNAPSNFSRRTKRTVDGGNQEADGVEQMSSENEAESTQSTSSPKDPDHVDSLKYDDHAAEDQDIPNIVHDGAAGTPDTEEQCRRSSTPCENEAHPLGEYQHLRQFQKLTQSVRPEHMKTFFTRSLMVEIEYSTGSSLKVAPGERPRELPFSIDRLGVDDIARLKDDGTLLIGKAEAVIGEVPLVLPSMDNLYVAARGDVFRITFH